MSCHSTEYCSISTMHMGENPNVTEGNKSIRANQIRTKVRRSPLKINMV